MASVPACYLGSAQSDSRSVLDGIYNKQYRLVYVTPEYVTSSPDFMKSLDSKVGESNNLKLSASRLSF